MLFAGVWLVHSVMARASLLGVIAVASLIAWLAAQRRSDLITDTPTLQVATAAQGYVELVGRAQLYPNESPRGPAWGPPSVWYDYEVYQRRGDRWELVKRERSEDTFLLVDDSGPCIIDPDHAEVYTIHRQAWDWAGYKYKMAYVAPGDTLYALGELRTRGGADSPIDRREEVSAVLREWKQDSARLRSRFDRNKDGAIDLQEWETARAAVQQQVEAQHLAAALEVDIHVLRAPPDRRPFLLATADPHSLARRYRRWAWLHLGTLVGSAITALVLSTEVL